MTKLFDNSHRSSLERKLPTESMLTFLNKSAMKGMENARLDIERMYCSFEENAEPIKVKEIKRCLGAKDYIQFQSAFFELFVYDFFKKHNCKIDISPKQKSSEPDFLVAEANGLNYFLEASVLTDKIRLDSYPGEAVVTSVRASISSIKNNGFTPIISSGMDSNPFREKSQRFYNLNDTYKYIKKWILSLDRESARKNINNSNGNESVPTLCLDYFDKVSLCYIQIIVKAFPMNEEIAKKNEGHLFNAASGSFTPKYNPKDIFKKVESKIKQHDKENLVVALEIPELFTMSYSLILHDLYGAGRSIDCDNRIINLDGVCNNTYSVFFDNDGKMRNSNLIGVILFHNVIPWSLDTYLFEYFAHPLNKHDSMLNYKKCFKESNGNIFCHIP